MVAIMGPSGGGKTSLLNILAGRTHSSKSAKTEVSGKLMLNGEVIEGFTQRMRRRIAYVMQDDLLLPTSTPREALLFSALLRLPRSSTREEKVKLVEKMLEDLGLTKCADTMVGSQLRRGISGGEKRRTSIGIELVMSPKLVFLDEPTSGLDSFMAHSVVHRMSDMARFAGCNVLSTIHQPSSEVFHTFDKVLLLAEGKTVYFGPLDKLATRLSDIGHPCPSGFNLADHALFLTQKLEETDWTKLAELSKLVEAASDERTFLGQESTLDVQGAPFSTQLAALCQRESRAVWRNKPALIASVVVPALLNTIFGAVFFQAGDVNSSDYNLRSHFGSVTLVAISGMMGSAQPVLLKFPLDRAIFIRDYASGCYGVLPYFLSKSLVELPEAFMSAVISIGIAYGMMGWQGNFINYVFIFWISGLAASSAAVALGSAAANAEVAVRASTGLFVPQMLFLGFFTPIDQIPAFMRWLQYICSLVYAMKLFLINEFGPSATSGWPLNLQVQANSIVIEQNNINADDDYLYLIALILYVVCLRGIGLFFLVRKAAAFLGESHLLPHKIKVPINLRTIRIK